MENTPLATGLRSRAYPAATLNAAARFARSLAARLYFARAALRQRRQLARLDAAALHDIGVSRSQAANEAKRPAWDVPRHWLEN